MLVAAWPLLLGRFHVAGDILPHCLPALRCLQQALLDGELFIWHPDVFSGFFVLGTVLSCTYYPPALLACLVLPEHAAYVALEVFHYWILVRGLFGFVRELGGGRRAAWVAAAVGLLGGATICHHEHLRILFGMAWLGPIVWASARLIRSERPLAPGLVLSATYGLALMGSHPQYVWLAGLASLSLLWVVPADARLRGLVRLGLAGVTSWALAAPLLLPVAEYAQLFPRTRVGGDLAFLASGGVGPADLPGWMLGTLLPGQPERAVWGAAFLVLAAVGAAQARRVPLAKVGLALTLLGLLLAPTYEWQPLHRLLVHVPPFSLFRNPGRYTWLAQVGIGLLAATAVDRRSLRRGREAWIAPAGVGFALLLALATASLAGHRPHVPSVVAAFLGVGLAALALRPDADRRWFPLAVGAGVLELAWLWVAFVPSLPTGELQEAWPLAQTVAASENPRLLDIGHPEEQTLAASRRLKRNNAAGWGVSYVSGYEPMPPIPQEVLYVDLARALAEDPNGRFALLCDAHSVRWISTPVPLLEGPALVRRGASDGVALYENLDARPQAYALGAQVGRVHVVEQRRTRWVVDVPAWDEPRRVVVTQVWYPGWEALLDGEPAPVELTRELYLTVDVPPGAHRVELAFDNQQVFLGQRLGLAAWCAWLGVALLLGLRGLRGGGDP